MGVWPPRSAAAAEDNDCEDDEDEEVDGDPQNDPDVRRKRYRLGVK